MATQHQPVTSTSNEHLAPSVNPCNVLCMDDATPAMPPSQSTDQSPSTKARLSLVLALASLITGPAIFFAQYVALILLATVSSEPSNPTWVSLVMLAIFIALALLAFALPTAALVIAVRARRKINQSSGTLRGGAMATAAQVVATIVIVGLMIGEVFIALNMVGACSLEGCP